MSVIPSHYQRTTGPIVPPAPWRHYLGTAGRGLISALFILSAIHSLNHFEAAVGHAQSEEIPAASFAVAIAMGVELFAGIALLLGFKGRWAALLLAILLLPMRLVFPNTWSALASGHQSQLFYVFNSLALVGGLLTVTAHGSGAFSLDRALARRTFIRRMREAEAARYAERRWIEARKRASDV